MLKSVVISLGLLKHGNLISFTSCSLEDLVESKPGLNTEDTDLLVQTSHCFSLIFMHMTIMIKQSRGCV